MSTTEMVLRLAAGFGLGAVIGLERQWRARMAGLRTNALVATGSALFVLLSADGFTVLVPGSGPGDPTRVAAQIVSGIGFLGGGVILREGLSVRGLNTAATLWCSAAVGSLAGSGLYLVAGLGAAAVVVANVVLRPIGRQLDRLPAGGDDLGAEYRLDTRCAAAAEGRIRTLLVGALDATDFGVRSLRSEHDDSPGREVSILAELSAEHRDDRALERALTRLSLDPDVSAVAWTVRADDGSPSPAAGRARAS